MGEGDVYTFVIVYQFFIFDLETIILKFIYVI